RKFAFLWGLPDLVNWNLECFNLLIRRKKVQFADHQIKAYVMTWRKFAFLRGFVGWKLGMLQS
uniref:Uncharacterized protein n=1 Tax=Oryza brachyantha TaxID=4533 RepID=J3M9B8_ORYBR